MSSKPSKKTRRPRITDTEALTLVEEVEHRGSVILGRLDNIITADKKNRALEEVTAAMKEVSRVGRTSEEAAEQRHIAGTGELIGFAYHSFISVIADLAWCG